MVIGVGAGNNKTTNSADVVNIYRPTYQEFTNYQPLLDTSGNTYVVPSGKKYVIGYLAGWDNLTTGAPWDLWQGEDGGTANEVLLMPRFGGSTFSGANSWYYNVTAGTVPAGKSVYVKGNVSGRGMVMICSGFEVDA